LSISDYLIRLSHQQSKPDLDDKFLESLESWVDKLLSTEYAVDVDDSDRIDEVVNFINKFIFIQTLDDYSVVEFNWIKNTWEYNRRRWSNYNKRKFAESFIADVREWFYKHYDTELFRHEVIQHIPDRNIDEFCDLLGEVLGLYERQSDTSIKGITSYDYREIDEDVFGKAYETYLAEVREDKSIYYTPGYISENILKSTVSEKISTTRESIVQAISTGEFEKAIEKSREFASITVLDPACGSGSFLIKAFREFREQYQDLFNELAEIRKRHVSEELYADGNEDTQAKFYDSTDSSLLKTIDDILLYLGYPQMNEQGRIQGQKDLTSKIVLRHIYGNDFDRRALNVTKLNIWLESVEKQS